MHIESTTHEHGLSGKVYTYEGDFDVSDDAITWNARVSHAQDPPRIITGTIRITSPAVGAIADKAVRDAIVERIDADGSGRAAATAAPAMPAHTQTVRTLLHDALEMFVGQWRAEGWSYGDPLQSIASPKAIARAWRSTHSARWHSGRFFLLQDEKAHSGSDPCDALSVMGLDPSSGTLFALVFDSRGSQRRFDVHVDGRRWIFDGPTERGLIDFSGDGRTQRIVWEWKPRDRWLPLSERTAVRTD
jgi:hypothetical protein